MIQNLLFSVLPILISLLFGYGIGRIASHSIKGRLISCITLFVWLLLISIGFQFGAVLFDPDLGLGIVRDAFIYSSVITAITFIFLIKKSKAQQTAQRSNIDITKPIVECVIAMAMVVIGMLLYKIIDLDINGEMISSILLYVLIVLVGVDLSNIKIQALTIAHIKVPLMTIIALFISAYALTLILELSFFELIVVGSGFGWFSLSGPLVAKVVSAEMGTFALVTDLFREFYAIGLLYLLGRRYPQPVIGVCGATAMDSTLPFVKNNCSAHDVQIAIFSGFILTILAPFFIVFFASLI